MPHTTTHMHNKHMNTPLHCALKGIKRMCLQPNFSAIYGIPQKERLHYSALSFIYESMVWFWGMVFLIDFAISSTFVWLKLLIIVHLKLI